MIFDVFLFTDLSILDSWNVNFPGNGEVHILLSLFDSGSIKIVEVVKVLVEDLSVVLEGFHIIFL